MDRGACLCWGKTVAVRASPDLFLSNTSVKRVFPHSFPFPSLFVLLAFYECFPEQSAALGVDAALGIMRTCFWVGSSALVLACRDACGAGFTRSSLLLASSRKSKRRMSGYWRNMVTVWWTTTKRGLPTSRLSPPVSSEVVGTIPKWACWRDASCQKTSSLTAASEHWMLLTLPVLSR